MTPDPALREEIAGLIARHAGAIYDTTAAVDAVLTLLTDRGLLTPAADPARVATFRVEIADMPEVAAAIRATFDDVRRQVTDLERERDDLTEALHRLQPELARIQEGAEPLPTDDGVSLTPGQMWTRLLDAPATDRIQLLARLRDDAHQGWSCFARDHEGHIAELRDAQHRCTLAHQPDTPWVQRADDGTLTVHWPSDTITAVLMSRDALEGLVDQLNRHAALRPIAEYVSRGRRYVDVEPYPDTAARHALGALQETP